MTQPTHELLANLTQRTEHLVEQAKQLSSLSEVVLHQKASPQSWNAHECLEHLCRYGDFYLPEITKRLNDAEKSNNPKFSTGLLGNYFAKMMLPGTKGMKTFSDMNPLNSTVRKDVLAEFIKQQELMLNILHRCAKYDLTKVKTSISISTLIKLRLGDTLRVVIYHNQRHMAQAQKACSK